MIYKEFEKFNIHKTHSPFKKWAQDMNSHFLEDEIQMTNRYMKKCSGLLAIREMHFKPQ